MKINVQAISKIETKYELQAPPTFIIDVHLRGHQYEDLFHQIWEEIGNEGISKLLKAEDCEFIDNRKNLTVISHGKQKD